MFCTNCGNNLPDGAAFCTQCGKRMSAPVAAAANINKGIETPKDGAIYSIQGVRGRHIDIYHNKCVITTKVTFGSILAQNTTDGEKTIYFKDCVGIQFKKSAFTIGYLQFETSANMMNNRNSNFFGENSFTFDTTVVSNEKMEEVANYVKRRIDEIKTMGDAPAQVVAATSPADEIKKYKELLDMGVISQEEFDAKKKQLLGL